MRTSTISVLALAAGAHATGFGGSGAFSCPANTNNECSAQQKGGYDFASLAVGQFSMYEDFTFSGGKYGTWACTTTTTTTTTKRRQKTQTQTQKRTAGKSIGATCHADKATSPSFGCGARGSAVDAFSLAAVQVQPEFDCELEFHYAMADGSACRTRSPCSSSPGGTVVPNAQCGGAKNLTIVYPPQPGKPKPTCSVQVHTMSFDCGAASTTARPPTTSHAATLLLSSSSSSTSRATIMSASSPALGSTSTTPFFANTTTKMARTTPPPSGTTTVITTSFQTTSTIYTTSIQTITACASTVTNCPARSSPVTTVLLVPLTTTVCPVTATRTVVVNSATTHVIGTTSAIAAAVTSPPNPGTTTTIITTTTSPPPTVPVPDVVPTCLNTFMYRVGCLSNADSACYCPSAAFLADVFDCIWAHTPSDQAVADAVAYLQGLCAPHAAANPAIVTAATVTAYIAASVTAPAAAAVTTVVVQATRGIPGPSSAVVVVATALTVPKVAFSTSAGTPVVVPAAPATSGTAAQTDGGAAAGFTFALGPPTTTPGLGLGGVAGGTGAAGWPTASGVVTVNGAQRVGMGARRGGWVVVGVVVAVVVVW
ncbi:hypothetical protein P8C59_009185 [Phyllachora maydis]|uniref:CFEM domain-containing protein n=1 Tax=Phyllachora maydis TaxID=1825666 RepID=A0AAD9ICN6_9PEZI|nr:hypothetical protein P8C59_009185 [Phyllachora maydis]